MAKENEEMNSSGAGSSVFEKPERAKAAKQPVSVYIKRYWQLYLLLLIPMVYFAVFKYSPMYYVLIAFKKYSIVQTVAQMPWAKNHGFQYFIQAFKNKDFIYALRNTIFLNLLDIILGFPVPIIFALLLNELRFKFFKKSVQTIAYMPHFLSWVIIYGLALQLFAPANGLINILIKNLGGQTVHFLDDVVGNDNVHAAHRRYAVSVVVDVAVCDGKVHALLSHEVRHSDASHHVECRVALNLAIGNGNVGGSRKVELRNVAVVLRVLPERTVVYLYGAEEVSRTADGSLAAKLEGAVFYSKLSTVGAEKQCSRTAAVVLPERTVGHVESGSGVVFQSHELERDVLYVSNSSVIVYLNAVRRIVFVVFCQCNTVFSCNERCLSLDDQLSIVGKVNRSLLVDDKLVGSRNDGAERYKIFVFADFAHSAVSRSRQLFKRVGCSVAGCGEVVGKR